MRDAERQKYAEMVHAHQTLKNRHGGIPEKKSHESLDHSTVLNRRDRWFVLVPVEICTETQPATASSYPTTVAESQRMGYDRVREQPSHAERIHWQQLMIKEISFDHSVMRATTIILWPRFLHATSRLSRAMLTSRPSVKLKNFYLLPHTYNICNTYTYITYNTTTTTYSTASTYTSLQY